MRESRKSSRRPAAGRHALSLERLEQRAVLSLTVGLPPALAGTNLPQPVGLPVSAVELPPSPPPDVTVPQPVATTFTILLPASVPNGLRVPVVLLATDAAGVPIRSYSGTAALTSSDPLATLPETVAFRNGRALAAVTFRSAGPQTLTVTDSADPAFSATKSTTVAAPIVATGIKVRLPAAVLNGAATTVELWAVAADGRLAPAYSGTVAVTTSDPAATVPATVTFVNGRASIKATFLTAGPQTLTVTDQADAKLTATAGTVVSAPQVLTKFAVMLPPKAYAGAATDLRIVALDAQSMPIRSFNGTVSLSSTDAAATLPATVTFRDGRAEARVTFATVGPQSVTVTGGAAGTITATASTTVAPAQVAVRFAVMLPRFAAVGVPVVGRLVALDADNRVVWGYDGTVKLTSSDAAAILPATVTFRGGSAAVRVTFKTTGAQTLTATDAVDAKVVGSASVTVSDVTRQR